MALLGDSPELAELKRLLAPVLAANANSASSGAPS